MAEPEAGTSDDRDGATEEYAALEAQVAVLVAHGDPSEEFAGQNVADFGAAAGNDV